jgi:hypothetical protein
VNAPGTRLHMQSAGKAVRLFVSHAQEDAPLLVHCCHCRWCQRETGTAFALNALIESNRFPPDIHIFTASKQPWVVLPPGTPAVAEYYKSAEQWPRESLERRAAALAKSRQPQ